MSVSLVSLRTRVRQRADQENSTFVSDSELNRYINDAMEWVYYEMTCSGLFPDETSFSITANGAASYTLPEINTIITVERQDGSNFIPLRRAERAEVPNFRSVANGLAWVYDITWGLRAVPSIKFYPTPNSGTYIVRYIPPVTLLSADGDLVYNAGGWDGLIVLDAAVKCVKKEGGDSIPLERERQEMLVRLRSEINHRDAYNPARVFPRPDSNALFIEPFTYTDRKGFRGI